MVSVIMSFSKFLLVFLLITTTQRLLNYLCSIPRLFYQENRIVIDIRKQAQLGETEMKQRLLCCDKWNLCCFDLHLPTKTQLTNIKTRKRGTVSCPFTLKYKFPARTLRSYDLPCPGLTLLTKWLVILFHFVFSLFKYGFLNIELLRSFTFSNV